MAICKWCNQPFREVKPWQVFCCQRHRDDWHLHQGKLARQRRLYGKLKDQEIGMNGHTLISEQRDKLQPWIDSLPADAKKPRERFVPPPRRRKLEATTKDELAKMVEEYRNERRPKLVRRI